jgi:hypothetical protein
MRAAIIALLLGTPTQLPARQPDPAAAATAPTARQILERAIEVAGGEAWLNPKTLLLEGEATFYAPDSPTPRSVADDYRMWRAMNRTAPSATAPTARCGSRRGRAGGCCSKSAMTAPTPGPNAG